MQSFFMLNMINKGSPAKQELHDIYMCSFLVWKKSVSV